MLVAAPILADLVAAAPPHVAATRTFDPPTIDGKLDDPAWKAAPPVSAFTQKFPNEGSEPSDGTTMRILYDDDAIYVAFECDQAHSPIVDRLTRRDREVEADRVSVYVGSRGDRKTAYEFTVDASGTLVDAIRYDDTERSLDWDENWEARTSIAQKGWTAELKIPLRVLRFADNSTNRWDFQARRYISEKEETDEWAFIPRSVAGEVSRYGYLDELHGLEAGAPLELRPFVLGRFRRLDAGSTGLVSGTDFALSAGLDLKWHPTDALVVEATFDPDFGQVEADQFVLNLTTYETYYPEKRPFFLEGIDLFSTPRQLLYTRRIGRAAPSPTLRTDAPYGEQLVDLPAPATIYGASKLVGSLADKWQIATLQALTARNDVTVQDANGNRSARAVDPLTAYEVVRIKRELPGNGYVGFMTTAVSHAEPSTSYPGAPPSLGGPPSGILCPSGAVTTFGGRCFNDAYVGSVDWKWRSRGGDWVTGGQLIATTLRDGPPRYVRDGTVIKSGDVGSGAMVYLNKEGGKHWVGESTLEYEGKKLDYNDLGYNQRSNDYRWWLALEYRELERWWELLETHARVEIFGRTNLAGKIIGHGYQLNTSGKLSSFWNFFTEIHWRPTYFDDREVGDGTALQRGGLFGYELEFSTDPTRRLSAHLSTQTQWVSDGFTENADAGVLLRALPQLDVELLPTLVYTSGEPRYAAAGNVAGEYVFGRLNAKSLGAVLRATYTFTPRLTLQTYGQLFLASGHYSDFSVYDSDPNGARPTVHLGDLRPFGGALPANPDFQQGALNVSAVLRWEYTLGSTLFLVYTRSQAPIVTLQPGEAAQLSVGSVRRAPAADVIMAKLSYWWRRNERPRGARVVGRRRRSVARTEGSMIVSKLVFSVFACALASAPPGCDRSTPAPAPSTSTTTSVASAKPSSSASALASASASASASAAATNTASNAETKVTFDDDAVGAPPPELEAVVGDWYVASENGAVGLKVDGSKWRNGEPSATLADQAKKLYGDRSAEFIDGVKAFAFFPFAVWSHEPPRGDVRISVRFYPEAGKIDQGAGILYDVAADGSYWGVRANALENNLLFFHVVKGHRTVVDDVRNVPTPSKTWHTLAVELRGAHLTVTLDDAKRLEKKLDSAPTGRIGLWSKADSQVLFDDFTVTPP